MASGTPHTSSSKRSSLHRLSHTILQLASPPFSRVSFDAQSFGHKKRLAPLKTTHAPGLATAPAHDRRDGPPSAYTPSIASAVDSQLSSPYSPLLPVPSGAAHDPAPVPPTTNELSEDEKMKLMRKVRKLSRVLGEIPAVEEEPMPSIAAQLGDEAQDAVASPATPMLSPGKISASAKKAFRRSMTFGQSSGASLLDNHDVHRVRSMSALRPSLNLSRTSPDSSDLFGTPSSPITFARPDSYGSTNDVSEFPLSSSVPETRDDFHGLRRRDSTASSVLLADQNIEQLQRKRAAKLSRHFGTSIAPELFRTGSPPVPGSPPALFALPTKVLSTDQLPRRSTSLRRKSTPRRPASLDIRPTTGMISVPNSPPGSPRARTMSTGKLKRSKSLWTKRPREHQENENVGDKDKEEEEGDADLRAGGPVTLSEKQRVLNVKRARKMAQLFGDNPPTALFQITNFAPGSAAHLVEDGAPSAPASSDGHRYERDSLATIISISTTSLSPQLSATTKARLRDSFISVITNASDVSGLVLTESDEDEYKRTSITQEDDVAIQQPSLAVPILSPLPVPRRKGVRPSTSPGPSTTSSMLEQSNNLHAPPSPFSRLPRTPPTPPPFANIVAPIMVRPATAPPVSSPPPFEFQTRRRRAAKLSKFFGVEVNQLVDVLPTDIVPPTPSRKTSIAPEEGTFDRAAVGGAPQSSLVIAEAKRRKFLGMDGGDDVEERDMAEVIDQLRRMKSC